MDNILVGLQCPIPFSKGTLAELCRQYPGKIRQTPNGIYATPEFNEDLVKIIEKSLYDKLSFEDRIERSMSSIVQSMTTNTQAIQNLTTIFTSLTVKPVEPSTKPNAVNELFDSEPSTENVTEDITNTQQAQPLQVDDTSADSNAALSRLRGLRRD